MTDKTGQALDLIDRAALLDTACCGRISIRDVRAAERIDAIPVIRCRDCAYYGRSPLMIYAVRVAMAILLAIGCFMGFSNDPALSGFYWLTSAIWILFELT